MNIGLGGRNLNVINFTLTNTPLLESRIESFNFTQVVRTRSNGETLSMIGLYNETAFKTVVLGFVLLVAFN